MKPTPKTIGMIPARYASSRFPAKLLHLILEKPLLQHTYESAKQCPILDEVIIAADDVRIQQVAESFGAKMVMTCPSCPTGSDRIASAIEQHPELFADAELIVNIQGDEPNFAPETITALVDRLQHDPEAVMSTAAVEINDLETIQAISSPKVVFDQRGRALYFSRASIPAIHKMGDTARYYKHVGIYCFRKEFLLQYPKLPRTPLQLAEDLEQLKILEHGYAIQIAVVKDEIVGVNLLEDVEKLEKVLCKRNISLLPEGCSLL